MHAISRINSAVVFLAFLIASAPSEAIDLKSPRGNVTLHVEVDAESRLVYWVSEDGKSRLERAPAGVLIDSVDLASGVEISGPKKREVQETFPRLGVKRQGTNHCVQYEVPVRTKATGLEWIFEARVFDDGVGFRYRVPGTGDRRIQGEPTVWELPSDCQVWHQTQTANYEGDYRVSRPEAIPLESQTDKQKRPVFIGFPMTVVYPAGGLGLITEAALYKYSGMTLKPTGSRRFMATFEDDPKGWMHTGPLVSPWRVLVLARDLNALVNSDVILALNDPPDPKLFPEGAAAPWIRGGKAPNTWCVFGNDGAQWHRQKWFVDTAAAMGCEYLLVDAGWRTEKWGWLAKGGDVWGRCAELCQYAAARNVGIILWHAYPEGRDDGPGLTRLEAREELFTKAKAAGVKGIKIDFFDSESRTTMDAYEDLLRRSARHQLMINFHGANKPTGETRTWPHEITREGIREQEYVLWDKLSLPHYAALPFTRLVAGHADFLPGYVREKYLRNTTAVFQIATAVLFTSPFLNWPDHPDAYLDSAFLQFVRTVPTVWDETRVLEGSVIGEAVYMARRSGAEWYIGMINCRTEPQKHSLNLDFLSDGEYVATIFRDAHAKGGPAVIESGVRVRKGTPIAASLPSGGGFVVRLSRPKTYPGWQ